MSNKKTLLNEGTIRRFMKLANMGNLAENYLENYDLEEGMKKKKKKSKKACASVRKTTKLKKACVVLPRTTMNQQ
jgi:hypothetical protein